jgi:hypothetical protein
MARSRRLRRVRAAIGEHKRAILGVTLLMLILSASSLMVTQYIMFYINILGFERIAVASLFVMALLLFAIELRHDFEVAAKRVLRGRKSSRRRRR